MQLAYFKIHRNLFRGKWKLNLDKSGVYQVKRLRNPDLEEKKYGWFCSDLASYNPYGCTSINLLKTLKLHQ